MRGHTVACGEARHGAADPVGSAEAIVGPLLNLVCANADVRRRLALKGASRRADGWPAWYFWFAGVAGAHELALVPPAGGGGGSSPAVEFAVRYFPHPDEDALASFAPVEQAARRSPLFDATGTPAVEAFEAIEPSLFHVATLAMTPGQTQVDVEFAAQDCWLELAAAGGRCGVRRAVRGFDLGAPVLDLLVAAHAYYGRRPPAGVEILREAGLCWRVDEDGGAVSDHAEDLSLLTVRVHGLVRFGADPGSGVALGMLPPRGSGGPGCVFRHHGREAPPPFAGLDLASWWRAASWQFVPSGLFCGCAMEDLAIAGRDGEEDCRPAGLASRAAR